MEAGDWIALVAVVISVGAAIISVHQAKTAKDQAVEAREANRLTREQIAREAAREQQAAIDAEAAALREAEKVELSFYGNGGSVVVTITNNGSAPVTDVELLEVGAGEDGPWVSWSVNRNIPRGPLVRTKRSILGRGESMEVATWLLDAGGQHVRELPQSVQALVRFRDQSGQWWQTTAGDEAPTRVSAPTDY
ncbi:hypothetical protein ABZX38_20900 [Streptomyces longwoodensis]|uniref:hypothetical protein n=1 Tax=Streptomyces longwoodensis TaxID=68231 RepID=UPI0033B6EF0D